jgi:3-oxoacyl-[acyl-carrier protein] reductase
MRDAEPLRGQTAIVTGGAQGIGRAIALTLAEAGARMVIGDVQDPTAAVREIEAAGGEAIPMRMDVSRPEDTEALIDLALDAYGRLDILVNNAGIDAPPGNAWDLSDGDWRHTIDVNLSSVFYCSRAALPPMLASRRGPSSTSVRRWRASAGLACRPLTTRARPASSA